MSLFTILNTINTNAALPSISPSDVSSLSELEYEAYGHWMFDQGDSSGLTSKINSKALSLQDAAPTYNEYFLTIASAVGDALLTDIADSADAVDTVSCVFRVPGLSQANPLVGTLSTSASGDGGGVYVSTATGIIIANYRGTSIDGGVDEGLSPDNTIVADKWYFMAVSRDFASATKTVIGMLGGESAITLTGSGAYSPLGNIALGNAYFTDLGFASDFAELVVFKDKALTATEMQSLYVRAKDRMALRGIVVE